MDDLQKRELESKIRFSLSHALHDPNVSTIVRELDEITTNLYYTRLTLDYQFIMDALVYDLGTRCIVFLDVAALNILT